MNHASDLDLGPLSWVKGEIDLALGRAADALKKALEQGGDADQARFARTHLHQAHGALSIVGLDGITHFSEALEQLVAELAGGSLKISAEHIDLAYRGLVAVRQFLDDVANGGANQPMRLQSLYEELLAARGQTEPAPSDLFFPDLSLRPPRRERDNPPLTPDELARHLRGARNRYELGFLEWLRSGDPGLGLPNMRYSVAAIEASQTLPASRAFWWVAQALFDALMDGSVSPTPLVKKLCSRIDLQIRRLSEGQSNVAERLMRDVLYYVAAAPATTDLLRQVKAAYRLDALLPQAGGALDITPLRPMLRSLRDVIAGAKDSWNKFCAGAAVGLPQFQDQMGTIADRAATLNNADLTRLARFLVETTQWLRKDPLRHSEPLAMEMATALLVLENGVENFAHLEADYPRQVDAMLGRVGALQRGAPLPADDGAPLLGEMSRKAQEKLLLAQVVREIQNNLVHIEQTLDAYFRAPENNAELPGLAAPLRQVEGALAMLGEDRAIAVLRECGARVQAFAEQGAAAAPEAFEEVAHKLSAIGFYVEALQHGPADLDALIDPRAARGLEGDEAESIEEGLARQMREAKALASALREAPQDEALRSELQQNLEVIRKDASLVADEAMEKQAADALDALRSAPQEGGALDVEQALAAAAPEPAPPAAPSADTVRLAEASSEEIDAELLSIFLEEAHDVLGAIAENLALSRAESHNHEVLTTIRRGFHTLKGSGRMVGLRDLGEAAWACEQTMNRWLQAELDASPELQQMIGDAHALFQGWVEQLEAGGGPGRDASAVVRQAEALRAGLDGGEAPAAPAPVPAPAGEMVAEEEIELIAVEELPEAEYAGEAPAEAAPAEEIELLAPVLELEEAQGTAPILDQAPAAMVLEEAAPQEEFLEVPPLEELAPEAAALGEESEAVLELEEAAEPSPFSADELQLGERVVSRALYEMFLAEARQHLATLRHELARMHVNPSLLPPESAIRAAHTLAGIAGTLGVSAIHDLARGLEHAQARLAHSDTPPSAEQSSLLNAAASTLESMVGQVAAQALPAAAGELIERLEAVAVGHRAPVVPLRVVSPAFAPETPVAAPPVPEPAAEAPVEPPATPEAAAPEPETPAIAAGAPEEAVHDERRRLRLPDDLDPQLLPIFLEEADDLIHQIGVELRTWRAEATPESAQSMQRLLHTLKGSARMAGAMGLGEMIHGMESRVEQAVSSHALTREFVDEFEADFDHAGQLIERLRGGPLERAPAPAPAVETAAPSHWVPAAAMAALPGEEMEGELAAQRAQIRVRAELIDRFVNEAGEMSIARARIEGEVRVLRQSLLDLTENVIRLRNQLREIEIQAEGQMQSRLAAAEAHHAEFDPLEMDRFTRFQEITRMMAESVNDVTTVQHTLLRNVDAADAALVAQSRLNRDLHQGLMSVRLVPFDSLADRLYRIVRQTAKEVGKKANLDIRGGQVEVDRSVLEKMTAPLEHLLRNAVTHGIEAREQRLASGKAEIGQITLSAAHEGNEIAISLADDGAGLDFGRIHAKAVAQGLLPAGQPVEENTLTNLIFAPGFSTASEVSQVAGRGVGMDVVQSEVATVGGRVEVRSEAGKGARFAIYLPQTTAVTQALLVRSAHKTYAVPSSMVEQVLELKQEGLDRIVAEGAAEWMGNRYPYHYLPRLLGDTESLPEPSRFSWVLLLRAGAQRIAVRVDALRSNQEVVLKKTGPQLARVIGVAGATVLGDGEIVLLLNPIALASRELPAAAPGAVRTPLRPTEPEQLPTVMVVDDSLTVRKITGRLLERAGYHVITAKDGVDALEKLLDVIPDVMLVDIEMPRMDGFDLTRNVRGDERLRSLPIIMITSRIADKHRNYAKEIGVDHYLGKPYQEDELLGLIRGYIEAKATA